MTALVRPVMVAALLATAACATGAARSEPAPASAPTAEPAAPPPSARAAMAMPADDGRVRQGYTLADVRFMQGMIAHHGQALVMARLASSHAGTVELRTLAERIDVSQRDEIAMMQRWLRERGEEAPDPAAHAGHDMSAHAGHGAAMAMGPMPGMATAEEMARLEQARGAAFDRLFLELMIRHHEGAITMVRQLFAAPGAGREPQLFRFAADVEADQSAEIARMRTMLAAR